MACQQENVAEDRLECPICLSKLTDPRILPCLHTVCSQCIEGHLSAFGLKFRCPVCRCECQVPTGGAPSFPKNFFLSDLKEPLFHLEELEHSRAQNVATGHRECDNAKVDVKAHGCATTFCADCEEFYCKTCASYHRMFGMSRKHRLICAFGEDISAVPAAKPWNRTLTCGEHPDANLDLYCDTCQVLICARCCVLGHSQHHYRQLAAAVWEEHQKILNELAQAAEVRVSDVGGRLKEAKASVRSIQQDTRTARQRVKQAANEMRELVDKRERYRLRQIQDTESKAVTAAITSTQLDDELGQVTATSPPSNVQTLHDSGNVTAQAMHTPGLQTSGNGADGSHLEAGDRQCGWPEYHTEDYRHRQVVKSNGSAAAAVSGKEMKLGPLLNVLLITDCGDDASGLVVVNNCVCVTGCLEPHLHIYDTATTTFVKQTLKGLQAVGMAATGNTTNTLVIADIKRKLHFVTFNQHNLKITKHTFKYITFVPRDISIHPVTGQLVIADSTNKAIVLCDTQGAMQKRVKVQLNLISMLCAAATDDGYVTAILDRGKVRVHWVDDQGRVTHTYGHRNGDGLSYPCHMVRTGQGKLVVADTNNHRVHLVDGSGRLLTRGDIQYPGCVHLEETTSLLYVAHRSGSSNMRECMKILVYRLQQHEGNYEDTSVQVAAT